MSLYKHWSYYLSKLKSRKPKKANCPICKKMILELLYYKHVEQCSKTVDLRARMYNEDMVITDKWIDECSICLENMELGNKIARLECLCVYHKPCIDLWMDKNLWCPGHPPQ